MRRVGVRMLVRPAMVMVRMGLSEGEWNRRESLGGGRRAGEEEGVGEDRGMGIWRWGFQVGRRCIVAFKERLLKDLACPGACGHEAIVDKEHRERGAIQGRQRIDGVDLQIRSTDDALLRRPKEGNM